MYKRITETLSQMKMIAAADGNSIAIMYWNEKYVDIAMNGYFTREPL